MKVDITLKLFIFSTDRLTFIAAASIFFMVHRPEAWIQALLSLSFHSEKKDIIEILQNQERLNKVLNLLLACLSKRPDKSRPCDIAINWKAFIKLGDWSVFNSAPFS